MADETQDKLLYSVQSIVADIVTKRESNSNTPAESVIEDNGSTETNKQTNTTVAHIRGKPKSGRFWKTQKEKFSTINKTKGLRQDFAKKTALRIELQRTKEMSKQALEEFKQKEALKKERRKENLKRVEENKRKSEIVQVISNTKKLKRMKKKQLRFIEKRDTSTIQTNK